MTAADVVTAEAVAYVPMSGPMASLLTQQWSEPIQMRVVVGSAGPELVFRSVSWKRLEPNGEVQ